MGKLVHLKHDTTVFKQIIAVTKDVMTEVNIRFGMETVGIVGVDPEKTAVVDMKLNTATLSSYEISEPVTIGVFLGSFHKLLRNAGKGSTVEMIVYRNAPNYLVVKINGKDADTQIRLKSLDIPVQNVIVPNVDYDGGFNVPSVFLYRLARELNHVGTEMRVSVLDDNKVVFQTESDVASDEVTLSQDIVSWQKQGTGFSEVFFGRYIEKLSKTSIDKKIFIQFKKGYPLSFTYNFVNEGYVRFIIAPIAA